MTLSSLFVSIWKERRSRGRDRPLVFLGVIQPRDIPVSKVRSISRLRLVRSVRLFARSFVPRIKAVVVIIVTVVVIRVVIVCDVSET